MRYEVGQVLKVSLLLRHTAPVTARIIAPTNSSPLIAKHGPLPSMTGSSSTFLGFEGIDNVAELKSYHTETGQYEICHYYDALHFKEIVLFNSAIRFALRLC